MSEPRRLPHSIINKHDLVNEIIKNITKYAKNYHSSQYIDICHFVSLISTRLFVIFHEHDTALLSSREYRQEYAHNLP